MEASSPEWPELAHLPMSQETVTIHETQETIEVWSRAGGCLRYRKMMVQLLVVLISNLKELYLMFMGPKMNDYWYLAMDVVVNTISETCIADITAKGPI